MAQVRETLRIYSVDRLFIAIWNGPQADDMQGVAPLLYPLKFAPIYKDKVWGGRNLEKLGRKLPGNALTPIGESWEVADLDASSPSGGGGSPERSRVSNGPLKGKLLHDLIDAAGIRSAGDLGADSHGNFPLLVKFIDAQENLSVQVHPSPEFVRAHPGAEPKSEAYYVVDAVPGAVIYNGVNQGVTEADFRAAIANGVAEQVQALLNAVPVKAGDSHYLPSGTCHAIGAGVLLAEVQTPADTTFRLFDWGRVGRELHVDDGMQSIDFGALDNSKYELLTRSSDGDKVMTNLIACEYFRVDKAEAPAGFEQALSNTGPVIWIVLEGEGQIYSGCRPDSVQFCACETLLIPGNLGGARVQLRHDSMWLEVATP